MMTIQNLHNIYIEYPKISTDTRNIAKDSLFFALKGTNFNGNLFALDALKNGASYAICDEYIADDPRIIMVDNVLETLQKLANYHRLKLQIPIIGITGTNGKTTTKELLNAVLSSKYKVLATSGNYNNHIGVPLTLLSITSQHEIAIVEMGANHIGDIAELCQIAMPTHGIITNIGKAHLEGFGSIDGVIKAKRALYDFIIENHGKLIVDADNELLMNLSKNADKLLYGTNSGEIIGHISVNAPLISVSLKNYDTTIDTQLVGTYNLKNILAAVATGILFDIDIQTIAKSLSSYTPQNNRSQLVEKQNIKIIMDAYNANPSSMNEALNNLTNIPHNKKILILGDMLELGEESQKEHKAIYDKVQAMEIDSCFLVGKCFSEMENTDKIKTFLDANLAKDFIKKISLDNSLILIKGSRGIKLETLLDDIH
jgi:UDP-N-acetylmuramoyl-tripeptide--D-alanyl-D-alanine ligase